MIAAIKGRLDLARGLIERGAEVNKPGWTPLHYAATFPGPAAPDMTRLMLEHHAYIDAESPNGTTPLMMAAMYGSPEAVKVLIQAGADLNIKNQLGMTALDFAVRGQRQNAKELIEVGLQLQRARAAKLEETAAPTHAPEPATSAAVTQPASVPAVVQTTPPTGPAQADSAPKVPSKPFKTGW